MDGIAGFPPPGRPREGSTSRDRFAELDVTSVDLPTNHGPMLTEPEELARVLLATAR
ncbi:hypothetical protein G443_002475 [Actinoalloteichus cyanogriseus DSM 43889]|uniref:Uncharacterized protein n=1 Tax=Actinoalloteichus caeruleus DSM 43889 TaxID=1120930 RepID=A0ABT1JI64_ACTCY|nr:hypothetical protein [Actinoalloteichus caeruleus DSM 43889]